MTVPKVPPSPALLDLLTRLSTGQATVDEVAQQLGPYRPAEPYPPADQAHPADQQPGNRLQTIHGATIDLGREQRCGFGEVIYGEGKSTELITEIITSQLAANQSAFVTRIDPTAASQVRRCFRFTHHNPLAHTLRVSATALDVSESLPPESADQQPHVAVVTAGSTDAAVAEEAVETLDWMGIAYQRFDDIGVAGPHRLIAAAPRLRSASAVVVIAGMEGALPAAVAGHVAVPIFAVPTSIGYGANLGGLTPLLGMLSSCTAGVAVVNIDAGFKGGYLAGLVASALIRSRKKDGGQS